MAATTPTRVCRGASSHRFGECAPKVAALAFSLAMVAGMAAAPLEPCRIEVVERGSGWPVPMVELRALHQVRLVTDNAGVAACDLPELLGHECWFEVIGHGYETPADGFGYRGVRLTPTPGRTLQVEVTRTIIARRLGRLTGAGLFAESRKTGREADWRETGVLGQDSIQTTARAGRRYWFWGDTTLASYPLGIFSTCGAEAPDQPLLDPRPPLRPAFSYFRKTSGELRGVAPMPGDGPTWISAVATVPDDAGAERIVASYVKIHGPLTVYVQGLCVWDDAGAEFRPHKVLWSNSPAQPKPGLMPDGHAVRWRDPEGRVWLLFGNPLPELRCPATFGGWENPAAWQPLQPLRELSSPGGGRVRLHSGSIAWSGYRRRWVAVFVESGGKPSPLGEVWYAEAPSPLGPWGAAVKVLSHENYTFYNPCLRPDLTPEGSPVLVFEGTYSKDFARDPAPTPRYDYNQMLYRLDLDDPALAPARAAAVP